MLVGEKNKEIMQLLEGVIAQTDSWAAGVMIPDASGSRLLPAVTVNFPDGWKDMHNALNSTTLVGRAFIDGEVQVLESDSIGRPAGATESHIMTAIIALPIKINGKIIAALEVIKDYPGADFSAEEVLLVEGAVEMIAPILS